MTVRCRSMSSADARRPVRAALSLGGCTAGARRAGRHHDGALYDPDCLDGGVGRAPVVRDRRGRRAAGDVLARRRHVRRSDRPPRRQDFTAFAERRAGRGDHARTAPRAHHRDGAQLRRHAECDRGGESDQQPEGLRHGRNREAGHLSARGRHDRASADRDGRGAQGVRQERRDSNHPQCERPGRAIRVQLPTRGRGEEPETEHRAETERHGCHPVIVCGWPPRSLVITVSSSCRVAVAAVGVLACASDAIAQQPQSSGTSSHATAEAYRTTLTLGAKADFGRGADPNRAEDAAGADALYTGGQFTLSFGKRLRRIAFGASAAKSLRFYQGYGTMNLGDSAGVNVDAQLRRSRFTFGQTIRRMPFQQLLRFADSGADALALPLTSPDMSVLNAQTTTLSTIAGYSHPLGRRAEVQLRYGFDESRQGSRVDRSVVTFGGGIRRSLSRSLDLRLGHTIRLVHSEQQSQAPSLTAHDLDLGVDYHRALSFSRRTSVNFSTGGAAVTTEGLTQYMMTGTAGLQHRLSRSWTAAAAFDRRLNMIEGIPQPVIASGLTTTVGGLFSRRAGLRVRGSMMQ